MNIKAVMGVTHLRNKKSPLKNFKQIRVDDHQVEQSAAPSISLRFMHFVVQAFADVLLSAWVPLQLGS